jgi:hypothetical protein
MASTEGPNYIATLRWILKYKFANKHFVALDRFYGESGLYNEVLSN